MARTQRKYLTKRRHGRREPVVQEKAHERILRLHKETLTVIQSDAAPVTPHLRLVHQAPVDLNRVHTVVDRSYLFVDKDDTMYTIIGVIQKAQRKGWTIKRIAEKSNVNYQTISKWIGGETLKPRNDTLHKVAKALGCKIVVVMVDPSYVE